VYERVIFLTKITLSGSMGIISALAPQILNKTKKKRAHWPFFNKQLLTKMNILNPKICFFPYRVDLNF